ncbi:E3 ubiquitin-protein ligase TRIM56-like [Ptychodera flava]|uniref:E3 ubiquitin-protein ligase TRIM56-like n=1 Tax=Ptychodera flava TaxID=63121 RepID=UPI00396A6995
MAAANSPTLEQQINEKILLCPICQERMTKPKILPCVHTFCEACLENWVRQKGGRLDCPTCRNLSSLPPAGVKGLNNNLFINDLIEVFQDMQPNSQESACDVCESKAAFWCRECAQFFCSRCHLTHTKARTSKMHRVLSTEEYHKLANSGRDHMIRPRFCSVHEDSQLELYCDHCDVTACMKCAVTIHKGAAHRLLSPDEAAKKYKPELQELVGASTARASSLREAKQEKERVMKEIEENSTEVDKQIRQKAAKMIELVKDGERKLLETLSKFGGHNVKELRAELDKIDLDLACAENLNYYTGSLLLYGTVTDLLSQKKELKERLQRSGAPSLLEPDVPRRKIFLTFEENTDNMQMTLGEVLNKPPATVPTQTSDRDSPDEQEPKPKSSGSRKSSLTEKQSRKSSTSEDKRQGRRKSSGATENKTPGSRKSSLSANKITGNMPKGEMSVENFVGFHRILYVFEDGIQGADQPNPGQQYKGGRFYGWLPDTIEGGQILQLLKTAFNRRLTFTIDGTSNKVVWNSIRHAESMDCYDEDYVRQLKQELASFGIGS